MFSKCLHFFKNNFFVSHEDGDIKEKKVTLPRLIGHLLFALLVLVFIYLAYTLIKPLNGMFKTTNGNMAKLIMAVIFSLVVVSYFILFIKKKTNLEVNIFYIMLVAFLIKLTYMLYTSGHTRQHDTWSSGQNGHYDYALYIFENFSLPNHTFTEANIYQFYHPPIYYYVSAIWMHIYQAIGFNASLVENSEMLFISNQILSTYFTFLISWYAVKTLRLFKISKVALYVGVVFVSFYPRLFQLSGQLNNDALATLFVICSIFRLFKYKLEGHRYKDFLLCGLYLGLAMCTKLSAVIVVLGYAAYFLYELILSFKHKEGSVPLKTIFIQYALFLAISVPIGLWHQFYAHYVYGIPFNFVFRNLNSNLFTGTRDYVLSHTYLNINTYDKTNSGLVYTSPFINFLYRFILPLLPSDYGYSGIFANAFNNYNVLTYALKSTIFGEFSYWNGEGFGFIAVLAAYILWFSVITASICNIVRKRRDTNFFVSGAITISIIVFYLYLQIKMPYGCSMDARYIVSILLPLGILIMKNIDYLDTDNKFDRGLRMVLIYSTLTVALSSGIFYVFAI